MRRGRSSPAAIRSATTSRSTDWPSSARSTRTVSGERAARGPATSCSSRSRSAPGLILQGVRDGRAPDGALEAAVEAMSESSRDAADALRSFAPNAVTDVTGFGLLGHAHETAERSGVRIVLDATTLPALAGALELALAGVRTGGDRRNREFAGTARREARHRRSSRLWPTTPRPRAASSSRFPRRSAQSSRRRSRAPGSTCTRWVASRREAASPSKPRERPRGAAAGRSRRDRFLSIAVASVAALGLVITSGAFVRLTGSGLGCDNWPRCGDTPFPAKDFHAMVEFGNRVVAVVGILAALVTWLASRRVDGLPPLGSTHGARRVSRHRRADSARRTHRAPGSAPARGDVALPARARRCRACGRRRGRGVEPCARSRVSRSGRAGCGWWRSSESVPARVMVVTGAIATASGPASRSGRRGRSTRARDPRHRVRPRARDRRLRDRLPARRLAAAPCRGARRRASSGSPVRLLGAPGPDARR